MNYAAEAWDNYYGVTWGDPFKYPLTRDLMTKLTSISRDQLISAIDSAGLSLKGINVGRPWMEFIDDEGNVLLKIHPSDSQTSYDHLHLYTKSGESLNYDFEIVNSRSSAAHIEIAPPQATMFVAPSKALSSELVEN